MEEFLRNITSPYWLVSVVVVGILINVASNYLQRKVDSLASRISARRREKLERQKLDWEQTAEKLRANPHIQTLFSSRAIKWRIREAFHFIGVMAFFVSMLTFANLMPMPGDPVGRGGYRMVIWLHTFVMFVFMAFGSRAFNKAFRYESLVAFANRHEVHELGEAGADFLRH